MTDVIKALGMSDQEVVLAEDYIALLDYFSRIAGGIESGEWRYVWDKLADLQRAAGRLRERLSGSHTDDGHEHLPFDPPTIDPARAHQAVIAWAQPYWAGRAIHPLDGITDPHLRDRITADRARAQALEDAFSAGDTDTISRLINEARHAQDDQ